MLQDRILISFPLLLSSFSIEFLPRVENSQISPESLTAAEMGASMFSSSDYQGCYLKHNDSELFENSKTIVAVEALRMQLPISNLVWVGVPRPEGRN